MPGKNIGPSEIFKSLTKVEGSEEKEPNLFFNLREVGHRERDMDLDNPFSS